MLNLLHHDADLVVIDKPPGLLVHRSQLDRHETRFAVQLLRDQIGQHVWPVHRLDKGTSGVLLFALRPDVATTLSAQIQRGEVKRRYLAIVRGHPPSDGLIDHPLDTPADAYEDLDHGEARTARTVFRRLADVELPVAVDRYPTSRYALLALYPLSGRRHQLRRHLKHIAHPIIGDSTYGKGHHNRFFAKELGVGRMLLACTALAFRHPCNQRPLLITTTPGEGFSQLAQRFGWHAAALAATDVDTMGNGAIISDFPSGNSSVGRAQPCQG